MNLYIITVILSILVVCSEAKEETKTWTNKTGSKIEAILINYDGVTATLMAKGKKYDIPVNKLSEKDQEWLTNWKKEKDLHLSSLIGIRENAAITTRYGATTNDYFTGPFGKQVRNFYDTTCSICDDTKKGLFMKCEESVAWKDQTMFVYCPDSYKINEKPIGIYINISASDRPIKLSTGYDEVMSERNLIYVSPSGTSNKRSDIRRMALVLDTLATLRAEYNIDNQRIFVGGVSGGGAMSAWLTVYFPEFRGAICQVRNAYIPHEGCFPTIKENDVKSISRRKQAFAWVTGPKDFNYKHILKSAPSWVEKRFVSRVFDIPNMGHTAAPAEALNTALAWAEESSTPPKLKTGDAE